MQHRTQKRSVAYVAIGGGAQCFAQRQSLPDMLETVSMQSHVGSGKIGSAADDVDAWMWGCRMRSLVLTIALFIDGRRHAASGRI